MVILTAGKGKNKREWQLNDQEFAEFEMRFEECELIDIGDIKSFKLTLVDAPKAETK